MALKGQEALCLDRKSVKLSMVYGTQQLSSDKPSSADRASKRPIGNCKDPASQMQRAMQSLISLLAI